MPIIKANSMAETYRAKAASRDINDLNGRPGGRELTEYTVDHISSLLPLGPKTVMADIGCGDGTLLRRCAALGGSSYIGILPNDEEVLRVRHYTKDSRISIMRGTAIATGIHPDSCDIVVCNNVLHGAGNDLAHAEDALTEFNRIAKDAATIYIGEIPDRDELAGKNYGDSVLSWLIWVLKNRGVSAFVSGVKEVAIACFSSEPFVISPKTMFYMAPSDFIDVLNSHGFEVLNFHKHRLPDASGNIVDHPTRWNYVCTKKST